MNKIVVGKCGAGKTTKLVEALGEMDHSVLVLEQWGEISGNAMDGRKKMGEVFC
jgi:UDP-galactopyranose mutase